MPISNPRLHVIDHWSSTAQRFVLNYLFHVLYLASFCRHTYVVTSCFLLVFNFEALAHFNYFLMRVFLWYSLTVQTKRSSNIFHTVSGLSVS